ncbi:MAG: transporter substrate-binding domain-containing protein [Desulfobacterota bacterium]|nr:transporter substrate-binding domain-containing protein [Thermodesulfobacteriota bacterium]
MKRISLLSALVWLLVMPSSAMANSPILSAAEVDYPPFSIVDAEGRAEGFSVELMRAALAAMGREVSFRTGPWAEVRGWLERGEIEALPLVGRTPERELLFDFTFPYMSLHGAIVVRNDVTNILGLVDLKGRQVAVMKGDNAEEFLRREDRGIDIHSTTTFEEALRELSQGRYDAVVIQRLVALRLIQEMSLANLKVINRPVEGFRQDFCFAVKEGDRETLALLNEGLALVMADGTYRHLHAKWFAALELPAGHRFVIGGDRDYPPFEYLDEKGVPAGYNVELTRSIAREMGLSVEIRLGTWKEMIDRLEKGEIDALQGVFYSPERDLKFDFSPAHTVNQCVSVVRRGQGSPPETLDVLRGKRIVVQQGDIMHDFALEKGLGKEVSAVGSQEGALRELAEGRHDCALVSRLTAMYWIKRHGWDNLVIGQRPLIAPDYCYAVPNNHKALLAQFSEGLKIIEKTGEYRRIQEKWLGLEKNGPPSLVSALRYSAMVLIPLLVGTLGFSLWSWSLRKQVTRRTAELAAVSQRHQAILDAVPDIIMEVDANKIYTWANPAGFDFFGKDVIGREAAEYFVGEQGTYRQVQRLFEGDENVIYLESWQRRKDGQARLLAWWCRAVKEESGTVSGVLSTARDITERKKAEAERQNLQDQLLQAQKMESVGRLAGGVAHDFNNILTTIIANADMALADAEKNSPLRDYLQEIVAAGKRAAGLTRQLLAFSRKQVLQPEVVKLNKVVMGMEKMLRRLIGEEIEMKTILASHLGLVEADIGQLEQVILNLAVNAKDAMPRGGTLTLEAANVDLDEEYAKAHVAVRPGPYVMLCMSDTGVGMSREIQARLFEPFFSTKEKGKGTGLGLATTYGIVKQSKGNIWVYSEEGKGSVFKIYLPRVDKSEKADKAKLSASVVRGGTETILIVEDEPMVRNLAVKVLDRYGYHVLSAENGREALESSRGHGGPIHLMLTDVVMPGMSGRELVEMLREVRPEMKVLYMSGYTDDAIVCHGILEKGIAFIQKPFTPEDMARKVREVLEEAPTEKQEP